MKTPEISVIIPAYNAQNTIIPCLDSIMSQDGAQDFQIIVINDGSTDETGKIVQEYRYNRPNIELANMPRNRGISATRNNGMRMATGRFISFVDADDIVGVSYDALRPLICNPRTETYNIGPMRSYGIPHPNARNFVPTFNTTYFTNLLKVAKTDTNIVLGGKLTIDVRENCMATHAYEDIYEFDLRPSDKLNALRNAYMRESANFALYERRFLTNKHIKFQPAMNLDEDILFCMQAVLRAETIITAPDVTYMYIRHDNSLSTPKDYWSAYDLSLIQLMSVFLNDLYNYPEYSEIFYRWLDDFRFIGQIAKTHRSQYPNKTCGQCTPHINKCVSCKKLRKLLTSNIQTLIKQR